MDYFFSVEINICNTFNTVSNIRFTSSIFNFQNFLKKNSPLNLCQPAFLRYI